MSRSGTGPPYGSTDTSGSTFGWLGSVLTLRILGETWRRRLLAGVGVAALAMAVLLVAAPWLPVWLVGPFLPLLLLAQAGQGGAIFLGLLAGAVGLWSLYRKTDPDDSREPSVTVPSLPADRPAGRPDDTPGERLNKLVDRVSGDAETPSTGINRAVDERQVRKRLRNTAVEVLTDAHDLSRSDAQSMVDDGTWTDSRRAAAFLGGPATPRPRLATRIRDWASGEPFKRRVYATVDEIARIAHLQDDEPLLDAPPAPVGRDRDGYGLAPDASAESRPSLGLDAPGSAGPELDVPRGDPSTTGGSARNGADDGSAREPEAAVAGPAGGGDGTTEELPDGWIAPGEDATDGSGDADGGESP